MTSTTGGLNLILVVSIIVAFFSLIFSLYFFNRRRLKDFVIFDISFILISISLLTARVLGMINQWVDYQGMGITLFPFEEGADGIRVVDAFPWEIIKLNDGNFFIWGIPIGLIIGGVIIYFISNKRKTFSEFMDGIILAIFPARLVLVLGLLLSASYFGEKAGLVNIFVPSEGIYRQNLALFELVAFIALFIGIVIVKIRNKQNGFAFSFYMIYEIYIGFVLVSQAQFTNEIFSGVPISFIISSVLLAILLIYFGVIVVGKLCLRN